jgi:predicted small lipoprotein YifL
MKRAIVIVVLSLGTLAACGQKGPLYLPGQSPKNAPWPPPAQPQPAPDVPPSDDKKK